MIKGKTKIEIFNVETGVVEGIYEDENIVTNAIAYAMNIESAANQGLDNYIFPIAEKALGGIMLFDNVLDEDVENIHFPGNAHLIGYADQSTGTSARRGSYNPQESGPTDSGYVSVWDFGSSQANGTIRSIGRTSRSAGANPLFYYFRRTGDIPNGFMSTDNQWFPVRWDGKYAYLGKLSGSGEAYEFRLARLRVPLLQHKVKDHYRVKEVAEEVTSWDAETIHWQSGSRDYYRYASAYNVWDGGDGYLYCIQNGRYEGNSSGDGEFSMFTVNYGDNSWQRSESQIVTVKSGLLRSYTREGVHVSHGYIYWMSNDRKSIYIINLSNTVDVRVIRIIDSSSPDYIQDMHWRPLYNGGVLLTVYHYTETGSFEYRNGILYEDGIFFIHDFSGSYNYAWGENYAAWSYMYGARAEKLAILSYYNDARIGFGYEANYLGTINNLASPIEKNASQTMKITYTLTDVEEGTT